MPTPPKHHLHGLKSDPRGRGRRVVARGARAGFDVVASYLGGVFQSPEERRGVRERILSRHARAFARELGEMKGPLMKGGQMLGLTGLYLGLPMEAVEALGTLEGDTTPLALEAMEGVLGRELTAKKRSMLRLDPVPVASASLGQVYRGILLETGEAVALKVQYPDIEACIQTDMVTLRRALLLLRVLPKGLNVDEYLAEIEAMIRRELDYERERDSLLRMKAALAKDERYIVPKVLTGFSTRRVLAMSFEEGVSPADPMVLSWPQELRNALGIAAIELFLSELFSLNLMQTDPHFGNYRVRLEGGEPRLVLLDFGATCSFPSSFIAHYRDLVAATYGRDLPGVLDAVDALGFMPASTPRRVRERFADICFLVMEPLRHHGHTPYDFGSSDLPERLISAMNRGCLTTSFRLPPREFIFLHRKLAGLFVLLAKLGAKFDPAPYLEKHLGNK